LQQRYLHARIRVEQSLHVVGRPGGGHHVERDARLLQDVGIPLADGVVAACWIGSGDGNPLRRCRFHEARGKPQAGKHHQHDRRDDLRQLAELSRGDIPQPRAQNRIDLLFLRSQCQGGAPRWFKATAE
jgi:hypothetical protein